MVQRGGRGYPMDGGGEVVGTLLERVEVAEQRAELLLVHVSSPLSSPASLRCLLCCYAYAPPPCVADDRDGRKSKAAGVSDR